MNLVTFNGVCVDFKGMEASFDGQAVDLTRQEFKILRFFSQNARRVISRVELMREAFGYLDCLTSRTVDNHIWRLRQKLERDPANPIHLHTVHSVGYRFIP